MASLSSVLYSYVFFLLLFLGCPCTQVDGKEVGSHHVMSLKSLLPGDVCTPSKDFNHAALQVTHRHGPCSPLKRHKKQSHELILSQDRIRVNWLHQKVSSSKRGNKNPLTSSQIPAYTGASVSAGNYIVTLGFGTPALKQTVVFDTGSDVTWIQCKPCVGSCYQQKEPIFDPTKSSTYSNISCTSPDCTSLDAYGCSGSSCLYAVQYGDNSKTVGFYAKDTLALSSSDIVPSFKFGCGENNQGLFGMAAGLLGLGREQSSLISQTMSKYGGAFSYCLPSTSSSAGYLSFGSSSASNVQFTPMLLDASNPSFYFLELMAISVGGQQLSIPPTVFSNAGTIIDSGTVITRLPPSAYSVLRAAFKQAMSKYPPAPAYSLFDTCYDLTGYQTVSVPKIALQFRGATANLDFSGILYVLSASRGCLAFAANSDDSDFGILGNTQQRKLNVIYDVSKKVIGFGPGSC